MFRPVAMIFAATLGLVAVPASADTPDDADSIAIGEAMDALRAKDFDQTVAKAQEIIDMLKNANLETMIEFAEKAGLSGNIRTLKTKEEALRNFLIKKAPLLVEGEDE